MYKDLIDWEELDFTLSRLRKGELTNKTLSQRIYRAKNKRKTLTFKLAQVIFGLDGADL